ncbi:UDP-N-acetylmuramate dehydrogenase [Patescibacteria group bacterium]|nr:UDP-N-acetylmuramate dehydrogenase [Patescibacteria group bacterium]
MPKIKLQKNIPLAEYTTFQIGGPAKYFFNAKTIEDLIQAVEFAQSKSIAWFILGGGSNLLISDQGFDGLVIRARNSGCKIQGKKIIAEAGVKLSNLVKFSIKSELSGLEWAVGIPGTVGGAVKVNAHAFGSNFNDLVKNIRKENEIILSVELELTKGNKEKSQDLLKEYIKKRKHSQPLEYPSAGCVFRNPTGQFAGQLIDQCGLKGRKNGGAEVSEKHANFIINSGNAKARDVVGLIDLIKEKVKEKFGVELEEEIEYLGF